MSTPEIAFQPLHEEHLGLLHGWLQAPHVREFWDDGDRSLEQVWTHYFEERGVEAFVFSIGARPAGYIQAYAVSAQDGFAAFRAPAGESWGIDLFIGEVGLLGRGYALPVIRAFLERLRASHPDLSRVLIDPEPRNARAVQVYRKTGFVPLGQLEVEGKTVLLMALDLPGSEGLL